VGDALRPQGAEGLSTGQCIQHRSHSCLAETLRRQGGGLIQSIVRQETHEKERAEKKNGDSGESPFLPIARQFAD
jgi:hypothetical protein